MLQVRGVRYTDGERAVMLWRPKGGQQGHLPIGVLSIVGGATSWGCGNLPDLLPSCSELYQGSGLSMWNHALLAFISQLLKQPDSKLTWEQVSITHPTALPPPPPHPPDFFQWYKYIQQKHSDHIKCYLYFFSRWTNHIHQAFNPILCILDTFINADFPAGWFLLLHQCIEKLNISTPCRSDRWRVWLFADVDLECWCFRKKELHRTDNLHSSRTTQRALAINKVSTGRCSFVWNHFQIFLFELLNRPCQNNSDYYPIHMLQHQPFM